MYLTSWWYKTQWLRHASNMKALIKLDTAMEFSNPDNRKEAEELLNKLEDIFLVDLSDQVNAHVVRMERVEQGVDPDLPF